ncbi:MAG TPA: S1C family serine protease [Acidimicrobiales bacterium]|nr:S1C family serine protease [Acidimicrobiales bacterium]
MRSPRAHARASRALSAAVAAALVLGACSDDGDDKGTSIGAQTGAAGDSPPGLITTPEQAKAGVVQISATGTFRDPEVGEQPNAAGTGSGFIIDPSGLAVTNNHVVTGAATIEVFVDGSDEPLNAQVLGVSECNDLAVIDIEGDGYKYFRFSDTAPEPGHEVHLAGFPLGDPEYTLTRGIIAKAEADGETAWSSLDHTLQHDAAAEPGNSGGPLVGEDGRVVGVHYASSAAVAGSQFFAIPAALAKPAVEQMREGDDVESIGVNGTAILDEASGIAGVWVASVDSGSPASDAGVVAGDIITRLENLDLATDGTMADYCDVLRTNAADDTMGIEVLRYDTAELLRGELNGASLEVTMSFADTYDDTVADSGGGDYTGYVTVNDDSGTLSVDIPDTWIEVDGTAEDVNGVPAPSVWASPNMQGFVETWGTPGMRFAVTDQLHGADIDAALDSMAPVDCVSAGRFDYSDPMYVGRYEMLTDCGGTASQYFVVASVPADDSYLAVVAVQVTGDADLQALDQILATFQVVG